ncbi:MAG: VWA domain-containing protein [Desulfobacteraceae bacterium]|nr:VWA domain-containing protein [Desulfobacteraceae bacterium]
MTQKTADEIVEDIWNSLKAHYKTFSNNTVDVYLNQEKRGRSVKEEQRTTRNDYSLADQLLDEVTGASLMDLQTNDPRDYWRMASYFNKHPGKLDMFFEQPGSLEAFARILGRLQDDVAAQAIKIASRLIIKVAKQIADSGYRSGKLELVRGYIDGAEIELDQSLERHIEGPERGILENLVSCVRHRERQAFVMMLDFSYSMQRKVILSAITAAAIAQHFKRDYAVLAFSNGVSILREVDERAGPENVLERLFALQSHGDTNIRLALEAGLKYVNKFDRKTGLLLTDGDWNRGGDPFQAAVRYDKLSVIGFPPAENEKIRQLALQGKGSFSLVRDEREIAGAILRCLN